MKTLYHYTSKEHFFDIRKEGKLKLTPSNIIRLKRIPLPTRSMRLDVTAIPEPARSFPLLHGP